MLLSLRVYVESWGDARRGETNFATSEPFAEPQRTYLRSGSRSSNVPKGHAIVETPQGLGRGGGSDATARICLFAACIAPTNGADINRQNLNPLV